LNDRFCHRVVDHFPPAQNFPFLFWAFLLWW
jgi:hypothetical protein